MQSENRVMVPEAFDGNSPPVALNRDRVIQDTKDAPSIDMFSIAKIRSANEPIGAALLPNGAWRETIAASRAHPVGAVPCLIRFTLQNLSTQKIGGR